jgi:cell division protein FtsI (penicillin-binding protein 3)
VETRKDILWRIYLVYLLMSIFALLIVVRVVKIQFVQGKEWKEKAQKLTTTYFNIEASRGNVFSNDGSLLATSVPIYEIRMDVCAGPITNKLFAKNVDSLALCLSELFQDRSQKEYKRLLVRARKQKERYLFLQKGVSYSDVKTLRTFPLFRMGKYKGGLMCIQNNRREMPFRELAARTLGYQREGIKPVGIEGSFNNYLKGVSGKRLMQKISGNNWAPVHKEDDIEATDGSDIYTTIDVNIQDVAHHALLTQLRKQQADHGCAALMEVSTGEIRAIVNLKKIDSTNYAETYNYVIGESTDPGSTFKLVSLIAAMEDGYTNLEEMVDTEDGDVVFYDHHIRDSHEGGYGKITLQEVFEKSSNVGVAKVISKYYAKSPQKFIDRLYKMGLNNPLNLDITGEGLPYIKNTKDKTWSPVTLPVMSTGYESRMTPLQILTFYNAVANDGKMVKPIFVKEIRKRGELVKSFQTTVLNPSICSKETIRNAKKMLEGVVERGTATNLRSADYKIAAKTGTAQIYNKAYGYKYQGKVSYQASLVGYFPASNPKYTCIVVVNAPTQKVYYGNDVAGPVFREIADKVYATSTEIHKELQSDTSHTLKTPIAKAGNKTDLNLVAAKLKLGEKDKSGNTEWVTTSSDAKGIVLAARTTSKSGIPNVIGMGLKDAIYLLENAGVSVKISGKGTVTKQLPEAGTKVNKGTQVIIELS